MKDGVATDGQQLIDSQTLYSRAVERVIDRHRTQGTKLTMIVLPNEELNNLPEHAFNNGTVVMDFDFSAEEPWVCDQLSVAEGLISCCLVYTVAGEPKEFWVKFPCTHVLWINAYASLESLEMPSVKPKKMSKEFEALYQQSKTKLYFKKDT